MDSNTFNTLQRLHKHIDIRLNNKEFNYNPTSFIFEYEYLHSLLNLIKNGDYKQNRTGIATVGVQHQYFHITDIENNFPILRAKKVYPKMALKELIWMLKGRNDVQWLRDNGVSYWDEWELEDGTIGRSYGYQYRNFNGVDQVKELLRLMETDPLGRRHIINLWNSADLSKMALPPCMYDFHFGCVPTDYGYKVDLHSHLRSNDSFLGAPYDFMFCGFFLILVCDYLTRKTGIQYKANDIHYTADDYHLYENHFNALLKYADNFLESEQCPLTSVAILSLCKIIIPDDKNFNNFDEYIDYIIANHKDVVKVEYDSSNIFTEDLKNIKEFGPIKADIAV